MITPKVGDELGTQVKIRITAVEPITAVITARDDFWSKKRLGGQGFEVGETLVFMARHWSTHLQWNIDIPRWSPWFSITGQFDGPLHFEHYK